MTRIQQRSRLNDSRRALRRFPRTLTFALLLLVLPRDAEAMGEGEPLGRELAGGGHVAYGIGGAIAPERSDPGFRHHLDLAAVIGNGQVISCGTGNSIVGCANTVQGVLFGASSVVGFGAYPTYVLGSVGYGTQNGYTGLGGFVEAGARTTSPSQPVLGVRTSADLLLVNVGVRMIASVARSPELGLWLTVGVGRF